MFAVNLVVPVVLGLGAVIVMIAVARRRAQNRVQTEVETPQGRILVHSINDDRCTGCDACVAVCPTNVLDLVDNKSRVLRFQDCIQCEACAWACPTNALVMHLEGTIAPSVMAPLIDVNYQTEVKGQYLIGEVAGKPLVKNAANLGRGVIEHMVSSGLQHHPIPRRAEGSDASAVSIVDVVIVGSGPGGLSAALSCIQRGLSYVVLEKSQTIASTVAYYPKGKLIMAEPYDCPNLSLLPAFDSSKEQMITLWRDLVAQTDMEVRLGESVETVKKRPGGDFDVRTTVSDYRAQRVVLATGTRGKPRTLNVPGENLPKVHSLLDDPAEFRNKAVLVVGGGDSALEAALALADAGASVTLSYRGRQFARAAAKNRKAIDSYAAGKRLRVLFQSAVVKFDDRTVTLTTSAGEQCIANDGAFVLIGSNPPIEWLATLGIKFHERPHSYAAPASDAFVRKTAGNDVVECPETVKGVLALLRKTSVSPSQKQVPKQSFQPPPQQFSPRVAPRVSANVVPIEIKSTMQPRTVANNRAGTVGGMRRWLRDATSIFSKKEDAKAHPHVQKATGSPTAGLANAHRRKHKGDGRRDALNTNERARVLRMLRDEGGRLADEDSKLTNLFELEGEFEKRLLENNSGVDLSKEKPIAFPNDRSIPTLPKNQLKHSMHIVPRSTIPKHSAASQKAEKQAKNDDQYSRRYSAHVIRREAPPPKLDKKVTISPNIVPRASGDIQGDIQKDATRVDNVDLAVKVGTARSRRKELVAAISGNQRDDKTLSDIDWGD